MDTNEKTLLTFGTRLSGTLRLYKTSINSKICMEDLVNVTRATHSSRIYTPTRRDTYLTGREDTHSDLRRNTGSPTGDLRLSGSPMTQKHGD